MEKPMMEKMQQLIAQMAHILHEAHEIVNAALAEDAAIDGVITAEEKKELEE